MSLHEKIVADLHELEEKSHDRFKKIEDDMSIKLTSLALVVSILSGEARERSDEYLSDEETVESLKRLRDISAETGDAHRSAGSYSAAEWENANGAIIQSYIPENN